MANIIKGDELMLFYDSSSTATPAYVSLAQATSHTLSISANTEDIASKDYGKYGHTEVNKISWEITSDNLFTTDYNTLVDKMLACTAISVIFGYSDSTSNSQSGEALNGLNTAGNETSWTYDTDKIYYSGKAIISSISLTAGSGANATYSITLTGDGVLTKHTPSA